MEPPASRWAQLQDERNALAQEVDRAHADAESAARRASAAEQELERARRIWQKREIALAGEIEPLQRELAAARTRAAPGGLVAAAGDAEMLQDELDAARERVCQLESASQQFVQTAAALQDHADQLAENVTRLSKERAAAENELVELRKTLAGASERETLLSQQVAALQDALAAEQRRTLELETLCEPAAPLSTMDGDVSLFSEVEGRRQQLASEHASLKDRYRALFQAHQLALQQQERLGAQLARASQLSQAREGEDAAAARAQALGEAMAQLESDNEQLRRQVERLRRQQNDGISGNAAALLPNTANPDQVASLQQQLAAANRELDAVRLACELARDCTRAHQAELHDKDQSVAALQTSVSQLRFFNKELQDRCRDLGNAYQALVASQGVETAGLAGSDAVPEEINVEAADELAEEDVSDGKRYQESLADPQSGSSSEAASVGESSGISNVADEVAHVSDQETAVTAVANSPAPRKLSQPPPSVTVLSSRSTAGGAGSSDCKQQ